MYESCKRSDECKRQGVPFSEGVASYELKEINIEAKVQKKNQYTSAGINLLSNLVFENAAPGHILAMETKNSDIDFFFLVRVVEKVEKLRRGEVFEEWGVDLCCERGSAALKVVRLFPSSRDSLWTFCDDTHKREFYVPVDLLRVGDLSNSIKTTQLTSGIGARTRSRCAVDVIGDGSAGQQASCYYEVVGNKARKAISHRCRLGLDYIYPPAAPASASSPSSASA